MLQSITLFLLISAVSAFTACEPFGTRIFFGDIITNKDSTQKLQIYFNTATLCDKSFIRLITKSSLKRMECTTTNLTLSPNVENYQTYIHKCSIQMINFEQTFYYNAFGWDGLAAQPTSFSQDMIPVYLANPLDPNRKITMIVLADWSQIQKNAYKYTSIQKLLSVTVAQKKIDAMLIIGDIGYDLDTDNCRNYQKFLIVLSKTAKSIPVIQATGNHEYNTQDNYKLYQQSFQLYGIDTELAVGLNVGSLYLVPFDPFMMIYKKIKPEEDKSLPLLINILKQTKDSERFILPVSHYPLACSGTSPNCKNDRKDMASFWNTMIDNDICLYIGAHYHTYQRLYPYYKNGNFSTQKQGFSSDGGYLISIVQGVAGNDKDIVESIDKIQAFTASYTVNETGFGILQVSVNEVIYSHLSTSKELVDSVQISRVRKERATYNLKKE